LIRAAAGPGRDERPSGRNCPRLIQIRLATLSLQKISLACRGNLPQARGSKGQSLLLTPSGEFG
jgi:hypothetical protein